MNWRNMFSQPLSALSMDCQMMTPATNGTTYGMNNRTRKKPERAQSRAAEEQGHDERQRTATGMASGANCSVFPSDCHVWASLNIAT